MSLYQKFTAMSAFSGRLCLWLGLTAAAFLFFCFISLHAQLPTADSCRAVTTYYSLTHTVDQAVETNNEQNNHSTKAIWRFNGAYSLWLIQLNQLRNWQLAGAAILRQVYSILFLLLLLYVLHAGQNSGKTPYSLPFFWPDILRNVLPVRAGPAQQ